MMDGDGYRDEMSEEPTAAEFESALSGDPDAPRALREIVRELSVLALPLSERASREIVQMAAWTSLASAESGGRVDVEGSGTTRERKLMLKGLLSGVLAKVLLVSSVALAAVGGAGATGHLPGPIQDQVDHVFGITHDVDDADEVTDVTTTEVEADVATTIDDEVETDDTEVDEVESDDTEVDEVESDDTEVDEVESDDTEVDSSHDSEEAESGVEVDD